MGLGVCKHGAQQRAALAAHNNVLHVLARPAGLVGEWWRWWWCISSGLEVGGQWRVGGLSGWLVQGLIKVACKYVPPDTHLGRHVGTHTPGSLLYAVMTWVRLPLASACSMSAL